MRFPADGDTPPGPRDWPEIAACLPEPWQGMPVRVQPAGPPDRPSARVWKVSFPDGRALAVKLAAGTAPVDAEGLVLPWLERQGAPVPHVVTVAPGGPGPPAAWLALEWCGDQTLDDAAQGASPGRLASLGRRLAVACAAVEGAFAPITSRTRADEVAWRERLDALHALVTPWIEAAPGALAWLIGGHLSPVITRALEATLTMALAAQPDVGSLDYNARNVVLDGPRLTLLDFAATGVDWPERRFVQYGTATGTLGGNFATVIGPASSRTYAEHVSPLHQTDVHTVQQQVDGHHVLLLLTAAATLQAVAAGQAHPERAAAWANVEERRHRLLAVLRRRLVPAGPAEALRAHLRR